MIEIDVILSDIIATDMGLPPERVVVYDEGWKSPKDKDIYITVAFSSPGRVIGLNNKFEPANPSAEPPTNDREVKIISKQETYNVEITSKNRDALIRYPEVLMALISNYSEQVQESNQIRIFRTGQFQDLSFIEGGSSLHRYRIPVIINSTEVIVKDIITYNKYQTPQEVIE